jgi:N-acetylated-alpha-linked acidic dipeptidase
LNKYYSSVPNSESALANSRKYATHPHLAGGPEDFADAKAMLELFQSEFAIREPEKLPIFPAGSPESRKSTLGLTSSRYPSTWIDIYYPVLNTPLNRSVDILDPTGQSIWSADLIEDGDERDPDSAKYKNSVPTFHGLSRGGEAEGQLVYASYGRKEDYDELVKSGANLTGKIVICRYGANFRGLKVLFNVSVVR